MNKSKLLQRLSQIELPTHEYWLIMGAATVLYGIREHTADIDLGCSKKLADELELNGYPTTRLGDGTRKFQLAPDIEVFENWLYDKVEYVEGVPVVSLRGLAAMKKEVGRQKDLDDVGRMIYVLSWNSPVGPLRLAGNDRGLTHVLWEGQSAPLGMIEEETPLLRQAREELTAYFSGKLFSFTVPLNPRGTPFQQSVWAALRTIPYGRTISYRDLATLIGIPTAFRAVGSANGKNPLPILIPCHRVIAADGSLGGYSLGLDLKKKLLKLELENLVSAQKGTDF